jgi:thioredoxin 1
LGNPHVATAPSANPAHPTPTIQWETLLAEAQADGQWVVAQFSAAWCAPCQRIKPEFAGLARAHPELRFAYLDIDGEDLGDVAGAAGVGAIPHFVLYADGAKRDDIVAPAAPALRDFVTRAATRAGGGSGGVASSSSSSSSSRA